MNLPLHRTHRSRVNQLRALAACAPFALLPAATACVTENTTTGEMVPRGNQRYPWEEVQERAKRLSNGMSKGQVLNLMGSPAEIEDEDSHWIYLPERHGILVPAQALHLEFDRGVLAEHEYRAIVLGAKM
jgi:outer membrane protein assembly factor BamE (lipoprotein component of BamABCDE complex)